MVISIRRYKFFVNNHVVTEPSGQAAGVGFWHPETAIFSCATSLSISFSDKPDLISAHAALMEQASEDTGPLQEEELLCTHAQIIRWKELQLQPIAHSLHPVYALVCPEDIQDEAWLQCQVQASTAKMLVMKNIQKPCPCQTEIRRHVG